jgi:formylglycine-generating enzyme required for sulfatase activity
MLNFPLPHLLGTLGVFVASAALVVHSAGRLAADAPVIHDTVEIARSVIDYPLPGEFVLNGLAVPAPVEQRTVPAFRIMRTQVSLADYKICVAAGECRAADAAAPSSPDRNVPVTGVSFLDAQAYAAWYSQASGETWRLPSDVELAAAAAEHFASEPLSAAADDPANPATLWLKQYRDQLAVRQPFDAMPKPQGYFGENLLGVQDFGGNVLEWTSTCYERVTIEPFVAGRQDAAENCDVHVLEGRHRTYLSNLVRNASGGGDKAASPSDNLGFRLVRGDRSLLASLTSTVGRTLVSIFPQVR